MNKRTQIFFCLLLLTFTSYVYSKDPMIQTQFPIIELYQQNKQIRGDIQNLNDRTPPLGKLKDALDKKSATDKIEIQRFIKATENYIPNNFLADIIYWRFIEQDPDFLRQAIKNYMLQSYFLLMENAFYQKLMSEDFFSRHITVRPWFETINNVLNPPEKITTTHQSFYLSEKNYSFFKNKSSELSRDSNNDRLAQELAKLSFFFYPEYRNKIHGGSIHQYIDSIGPVSGNKILNLNRQEALKEFRRLKKINSIFTKKSPQFNLREENLKDENNTYPQYYYVHTQDNYYLLKSYHEHFHYLIEGPIALLFGLKKFDLPNNLLPKNASTFIQGGSEARLISHDNQNAFALKIINQASSSIRVNLNSFKIPISIIDELIRKKLQFPNLEVEVIISTNELNNFYSFSLIQKLKETDIKVIGKENNLNPSTHIDFILIDDSLIFYPQFNSHETDQVLLALYGDNLVLPSARSFQRLWNDRGPTVALNIEDKQISVWNQRLSRENTRTFNRLIESLIASIQQLKFD